MRTHIDLKLERGVATAMAWLEAHPGRDACDAATAAIMNNNIRPGHIMGEFDEFGRSRWAEFLAAVEEAMA
jgi:hypothetical protein